MFTVYIPIGDESLISLPSVQHSYIPEADPGFSVGAWTLWGDVGFRGGYVSKFYMSK